MLKKLTPVLIVPTIEPVLPFWEALGFARTVEVPEGDRLGFVILNRDAVEVMLQSHESVRHDEPRVLDKGPAGAACLYVEVDDLEEIAARVPKDAEVIVARRTTPYGATETIVRDPAGNVVAFAQMGG
jgi:uncharacterized glyoxalase superfamily protein PhnB